jgi:putative acetyltransferase
VFANRAAELRERHVGAASTSGEERVVDVTIERVAVATDEIRELLDELNAALSGPYLPEQHHYVPFEQLFEDNVRFFAARVDGVAVGCGGVAFYDGFAEVKRMFTRPTARRLGVAAAVLRKLEAEAKGAGYTVLRLETGMYQDEAIAFYERKGFTECAAFGDYLGMTPREIETSVFYEKSI